MNSHKQQGNRSFDLGSNVLSERCVQNIYIDNDIRMTLRLERGTHLPEFFFANVTIFRYIQRRRGRGDLGSSR
jgi:hypothetical protein